MFIAIKFENVSKQYRLGEIGTGTLSHDLHRAWARLRGKPDPFAKVGQINDRTKGLDGKDKSKNSDYVWALRDIDFEVKQGEILGVIGRNGAGKSTLLKLLSRVTAPTGGSIKAKGRIASLLEVGTGFHPELTGRENIYLNGAILGMRRHEIKKQLDQIVEFSGCAKYIDTPVKRYSSGMMVRLGFSVAAHLECEIMVVDEVLAVGDADFQKACIAKMQDVSKSSGRTILFVSHNLGAVANLCTSAVLLANGSVRESGSVESILTLYEESVDAQQQPTIGNCRLSQHFTGDAEFLDICLAENRSDYRFGETLEIDVRFVARKDFTDLSIGGSVFQASGDCIATFFTPATISARANSHHALTLQVRDFPIVPGNYYLGFSIGNGNERSVRSDHDVVVGMPRFTVRELDLEGVGIAHWYRGWGPLCWSDKVNVISQTLESQTQ